VDLCGSIYRSGCYWETTIHTLIVYYELEGISSSSELAYRATRLASTMNGTQRADEL
jgi:hypothetical protein